jgi:hypothetical protein
LSVGGGGALVAVFVTALALGAPFCPSAGILGIPCPGCGLTRATIALLKGDVKGACSLHPLVFVVVPAFAALLGRGFYTSFVRTGRRPRASARSTTLVGWGVCTLAALMIALWLARFAGYFGGPVPVTTYAEWARSLGH